VASRIDEFFLAWARGIVARPWLVIAAVVAVAGATAYQIRHVTFDFTPESFLSPGHPERERYNDFRRQFGTDNTLVLAVRPDDPWSPDFLDWLRELQEAIEAGAPHINDITSLVNARVTRGNADSLIVEDLMEEWPETPAQFAAVKARALDNPFYQNLLINHENRLVVMLIELATYGGAAVVALDGFEDAAKTDPGAQAEFLTGRERDEAVDAINKILAELAPPGLEIHMVGNPSVAQRTVALTQINMARFTAISIAAIAIVLAILRS
jgi:predicted RND superfamily exporter protein